jgi:hypothetical protein
MLRMLVFMSPWLPWALSSNYVLTELSSYAIWDKSKIIMAISAAIWVINLGFQLAGKLTWHLLYPL